MLERDIARTLSNNSLSYSTTIPIVILHYWFQCYKHNLQTKNKVYELILHIK